MILKFVRDQYPQARFQRIYDAAIDGWYPQDFHRCCDKKEWTLTVVETNQGFIFGGFTTALWDSSASCNLKKCPHTFLFSVKDGTKHPLNVNDTNDAIECHWGYCARFGNDELVISPNSNNNNDSWIRAGRPCF